MLSRKENYHSPVLQYEQASNDEFLMKKTHSLNLINENDN